ncbi:MAG: tryptophan synthase subunit beta, partial [candidate division WOR-3 bacterium]
HGAMSYILQNQDGQIIPTHSIAPGLDYPGVGPEHAYLKETKRICYTNCTDRQAIKAFKLLSEIEGIIPALESAHAVYIAIKIAKRMDSEGIVILNLSGRGEKDLEIAGELYGYD